MIEEGRELPQSVYKVGSQERGNKGVQAAGLVRDLVIKPIKEGFKEFMRTLPPPEVREALSIKGKEQPEQVFIPIDRERTTTRPNTESKASPTAVLVSDLERVDRIQSQARINEILRELQKAGKSQGRL